MNNKYPVLVDSHVHIYDCYNIKKFIYCALDNFKNTSDQFGYSKFIGVIFLTESNDLNYFVKIKNNLLNDELNQIDLKLIKNNEDCSLTYKVMGDNYLIFIAGQQIITKEKLELLALGTTKRFKYGVKLSESLRQVCDENAIPILPWGFAKWIGNRGKFVKQFIESNENAKYFLGDNSGRLAFGPTPKLFRIARNHGKIVLRGSDPLPFNSQEKKAGSFGFLINENIDLEHPANDLKRIILNFKKEPNNFGKLETPLNFCKSQLLMQLRKVS